MVLAVLGAAALVTAVSLRAALYGGGGGEVVAFELRQGQGLQQVARSLKEQGILDAAWKLRAVALLEGGASELKAGRYRLAKGASAAAILRRLVEGEVETATVTILEGWTAAQFCAAFADSMNFDAERFLRLVRGPSRELRSEWDLPDSVGLEGYLYPETYRLAPGLDEESLLGVFLSARRESLNDAVRARMAERQVGLRELLTLASIVEAEARRDDERAKIAAVYWNRLGQGWKLEADPTVAYALGKQGQRLSYRDLEVDSAYNTYRHGGLPPGPIGSPGAASVEAVLWPAEDFPAMYFVADGEGGHVFSETWEEHQRAVREYRRKRRARSQG
jgi:UPF0755 protein